MKLTKLYILIAIVFAFETNSYAAETPTENIDGVPTESAIQIIEVAVKDFDYSLAEFNRTDKVLVTDWIEWTVIAVSNRAKLQFEAINDKVVITMINRQYKSDEGWSDTPTKLSKKAQSKYLGKISEKIKSIAEDEQLVADAVYNSELIKCFKPVITLSGIEVTVVRTVKDSVIEGKSKTNLIIEFNFKNTTSETKEVSISNIMWKSNPAIPFRPGSSKPRGFDKVITWPTGRYSTAEVSPNEEKRFYVYLEVKDNKEWNLDKLPDFYMRFNPFEENDYQIYNVPIPYVNPDIK